MKCLNRIEIQEYIDKEVIQTTIAEINNHLGTCEKCRNLYKQSLDEKDTVNRLFRTTETHFLEKLIPEFIPPVELITKKKYVPLIIKILAAASIIGFIFLFRPQRMSVPEKKMSSEILLFEFYDGRDLNKMWHEKSQIMILQDEKGDVIQSIITN
jgi:hypothetical protein